MRTALALAAVSLFALPAGAVKAGDHCQRAVAVTYVPVRTVAVPVAVAADYCQPAVVVDETPVLLNRTYTYGGGYGYNSFSRRAVSYQYGGGFGMGNHGTFVGGRVGVGAGGGGGGFIANTVDSVNRLVNSPAGSFALGAFVSNGFKFGRK